MRRFAVLPVLLAGFVVFVAFAVCAGPATPPAAVLTAEECAVWSRELSFARSVAEHDAAAFASHLDADAAFGAGRPEPTRGRERIAERWAPLIEGKSIRLSWYPTRVTIAGAGDIAWSSGPALYQHLNPGSGPRYELGAFHSVWRRGRDGAWRVLFDDGIEPRPATEAEAMAFQTGRRTECPQG